MPYGTVKVDNVTFTNNSVDATTTFSGIYASITNNLTLSGTATATTFTGTTANFTNVNAQNIGVTTSLSGLAITGGTAGFTTITGTTVTGTTANFVTVSGTTVTGNTGQFTNLAGAAAGFTTVTGTTVTGTTANFVSGVFTTRISGTTVTGTTASFTSGVFASLSGTTATFTSGIIASGTAALPSLAILSDPNTGIFSPGADQLAVATNGTEKLIVLSNGNVGIGTSSPDSKLSISSVNSGSANNTLTGSWLNIGSSINTGLGIRQKSSDPGISGLGFPLQIATIGGIPFEMYTTDAQPLVFGTSAVERLRITSAGLVGIGTTSPSQLFHLVANNCALYLQPVSNAEARIQAEGFTNGVGTAITFHNYNGSTNAERARIDSSGRLLVGTTDGSPAFNNVLGIALDGPNAVIASCRDGNSTATFGRKTNDGDIVEFYQDGTKEGTISVSGTTVSYNGAHLSRWSQLPSGAERTEILRGTVLSNIDEMCEWGEEDNEQLNRMKVSDVEGDKNVSGVFQAWDDDDDTYTNDFYCAMTGDFIIRISEGVTVERGDLLTSAGDGTAKPQDDDIIRSKTIAKVTSTNVSCTYEDGSYCVPCVLMAC